jgi:hypothetical protein
MENSEKMTHGNRVVSWILRGFLLLFALFFMLFSFDVFSMDGSFLQKLEGFLVHNVFTICMLLILWLAWKHEHFAGLLLISMCIFMVFFFGGLSHVRGGTWMMISLPFLVGILFLGNYYLIKTKH